MINLTAGTPGANTIDVWASPAHREELLRLLDGAGVRRSKIIEFAAGPQLAIYAVSASTSSMAALAAVLNAVFRRHRDKRFKLTLPGGEEIQTAGYSQKEVEKLLAKAKQAQLDQDARDATGMRALEEGWAPLRRQPTAP